MIKICYIQRKPQKSQISLERLFGEIQLLLKNKYEIENYICKYYSKGIANRLLNLLTYKKKKFDIYHITGDIMYMSLVVPGKKTVVTIPDVALLHRLKGLKLLIVKILWFQLPLIKANVCTTISLSVKMELIKIFGSAAESVKVVHCCLIDNITYSPKEWNNQKPICLQIGTSENKNLIRLIKAIQNLNVKLHIIGVVEISVIQYLIKYNIDFVVLGKLTSKELIQAYVDCDFVFFGSVYEGFGLPIIEAQATGRPLITSNCYSMPEVAGAGALFINPFSVEEIRSSVIKICNDENLRKDLVLKGLNNSKNFTSKKIADKYIEIYENM